MKYGDLTLGQIEAVVNKLGGEEGVDRLLRGELILSERARSWREEDGVIYFSVTSDGTTGPQWKDRLEKKGLRVSEYAQSVLYSKDFKPTSGVTTEIGVLKGELFTDSQRTTRNIRLKAVNSKMILPEAEVACLIWEKFSDKDLEAMGLWWIVVMHDPIKDSVGDSRLLYAVRGGGGRWLSAGWGDPGDGWDRGGGFAFVVSQVP